MSKLHKKKQPKSNPPPETLDLNPIPLQEMIRSGWLFPLLATLLLLFALSLRLITDIDIGFHLHGGQWIWEHKSFPDKDAYTYTVSENDYIDLHWLYQVMLYAVYSLSGFAGVSIFNSVLVLIALLLLVNRFRGIGTPMALAVPMLLAVGMILELRYAVRPEILTWSFLLLTILILETYERRGKNNLIWLAAIHLVWVNMQGLFILGWGVMGAYCLSSWVHQKKIDWLLWRYCIVAGASCLLNPYHLNGILFPFYLLTRLNRENVFKEHISEFISPFDVKPTDNLPFISVVPIYLFFAFSMIGFGLLLITFRKRKLHEFILFGAFFFLSASQIRNIPLFPLVVAPIIATAIREIGLGLNLGLKNVIEKIKRFEPLAALAVAVMIMLFAVRVVNNAYYQSDRRFVHFGAGLQIHAHPVKAAEFLNQNQLDGKILNDLNVGAYLGWKLKQKIFIDGRLEVMREAFFSEYKTAFQNGGLKSLIEKYKPDLIAFDFLASVNWNQQLRQLRDWRLIYLDETSAVYAHQQYASSLPAIQYDEAVTKLGIQESFSDAEKIALLNGREKSKLEWWLSGFWQVQPYPYQLTELGVFCYQNGAYRAGERCYWEYVKQTNGELEEIFFNLGSLYYRDKQFSFAKACYEKFLRMGGAHPLARQRLQEIALKKL